MIIRYTGAFELSWLRDDEQVAGDGDGNAIILRGSTERRICVGDLIEVGDGYVKVLARARAAA